MQIHVTWYTQSLSLPKSYSLKTARNNALDPAVHTPGLFLQGANALVTYALISGADDSFRIDPESGDLIATKRLDREHRSKYSLLVRADDGLQSSDMRINITISDVNDHTPKFSRPVYSFDILEDTTPGR